MKNKETVRYTFEDFANTHRFKRIREWYNLIEIAIKINIVTAWHLRCTLVRLRKEGADIFLDDFKIDR